MKPIHIHFVAAVIALLAFAYLGFVRPAMRMVQQGDEAVATVCRNWGQISADMRAIISSTGLECP